MARVWLWPGTMSDGDTVYRLVSDGFVSYLQRQADCTPIT